MSNETSTRYTAYCPTTGESIPVASEDEAMALARQMIDATGLEWAAVYSAPVGGFEDDCGFDEREEEL